jgi:hypothetical protein
MPTFIFHVKGHPDDQEMDLPDIATAKCEAVRFAGQLICDEADGFWDAAEFSLTVMDERRLILFSLTMLGQDAPALGVSPPA